MSDLDILGIMNRRNPDGLVTDSGVGLEHAKSLRALIGVELPSEYDALVKLGLLTSRPLVGFYPSENGDEVRLSHYNTVCEWYLSTRDMATDAWRDILRGVEWRGRRSVPNALLTPARREWLRVCYDGYRDYFLGIGRCKWVLVINGDASEGEIWRMSFGDFVASLGESDY